MGKSKLLTAQEYSDQFDIPIRTVYHWISEQKSPHSNIIGFENRFGRKLIKIQLVKTQ